MSSDTYNIVCPVYKLVKLSRECIPFVKHKCFRDLKEKKQLGSLNLTRPTAYKTRHEHSLGVAHLARYVTREVLQKHHNLSAEECLCVELAGLYHDVGHGPYSHSFDYLLEQIEFKHPTAKHEVRSMYIFEYVAKQVGMESKAIELVKYFIDPSSYVKLYKTKPEFTPGLDQIVNNTVCYWDVDKMDYLIRDSQALLLDQILSSPENEGILFRSRLINGNWTFSTRDYLGIYNLCCRRFTMYSDCYLEKNAIAVSYMITDAIKILDKYKSILACAEFKDDDDITTFCGLTDESIQDMILNDPDVRLLPARTLLMRAINGGDGLYKLQSQYVQISGEENNIMFDVDAITVRLKILTDKSNPANMMAKIPLHLNGIVVTAENICNINYIYRTGNNSPSD
jgi:HD superfamily phosphohydrolase